MAQSDLELASVEAVLASHTGSLAIDLDNEYTDTAIIGHSTSVGHINRKKAPPRLRPRRGLFQSPASPPTSAADSSLSLQQLQVQIAVDIDHHVIDDDCAPAHETFNGTSTSTIVRYRTAIAIRSGFERRGDRRGGDDIVHVIVEREAVFILVALIRCWRAWDASASASLALRMFSS